MNTLKTFDTSYFIGNNHFEEDGKQNYLVFQPIHKYFKLINNTLPIFSWQSKESFTEYIDPPTNSLSPSINYVGSNINIQSNKLTNTYGKVVKIYIVYELGASSSYVNDRTLKNCSFSAVILTKNTDISKYGYSGYGIGFDRRGSSSFPSGGFGQNVLIFGWDMSSSAYIDNRTKDIFGYISSWKRTNTRIRTYINCRKNVFN